MSTPQTKPTGGLRLHDLIGLVVGYGMAALLAKSFWPKSKPLMGIPAIAFGFEFLWLGLAMSGPIVLLLDRRGGSPTDPNGPSIQPKRPGWRISSKQANASPIGRGPVEIQPSSSVGYTKAELAWLLIGAYWIALTLFVVPALSIDTPWALVGLLQVVAAFGLWLVVPRHPKAETIANSWTHAAAVVLLWTWPFAWIFLILLSRSL